MKKLLKYDFLYLLKTQKFVVFFGIFILFSIISPLTAKYLNEILAFLLNGQDSSILGDLPTPDVQLGYSQYISDLLQTILYVVLFVSVSIFIRDKTKGLQLLIFSKPINRTKYVISKYISFLTLLAASILVGYFVFSYYVYILFDDVFIVKGLGMMGMYFLYLAFLSAVALFFATISKSYLVTILLTFLVYIVFSIFNLLKALVVFKYLPGMIPENTINILYDVAKTSDIVWNIVITVIITAALVISSSLIVRNRDAN